ncbi:MAG: hypothetical protein KAR17_14320 [Cyclobacteriaceae bacterium]|nr:hypothetical protein [Cyclobacteriaceae bacterium]
MLVGTSVTEITPTPGVELSGFAIRTQPSDQILDPLHCKVIYLESGMLKIFWLQLDLIGIEMSFVQKVRLRLSSKFNIPATNFIISATHTHSGPGTLPLNFCGEYRPDYLLALENVLEDCCEKATENREACLPMFGKLHFELAIDRRENDNNNIDPYLKYMAWIRPDKTIKAVLWNYAMHPVCLKGTGISADYPGIVGDEISNNLPGEPLSVFGLGACGNINPPEMGVAYSKMTLWAKKIALALTDDIVTRLTAFKSLADGLQIRNNVIHVKTTLLSQGDITTYAKKYYEDAAAIREFGPVFLKAIEKWEDNMKLKIVRQGSELPIEIFCLTIGDTKILGVSAEVFSSLAKLWDQGTDEKIMIITCVNGAQGYFPDVRSYDGGGYETDTSCFFYNLLPPRAGSLEEVADGLFELI